MTIEHDAVDYKNPEKTKWRCRVWSQLSKCANKDGVVLYLPGERNLDLSIASRRGFKPYNLIAVERNDEVVSKLRDEKQTVINGDLLDVMINWPADTKVSAVIADLQCGFTKYTNAILYAWLVLESFSESMLVLNMQRGRESRADGIFHSHANDLKAIGFHKACPRSFFAQKGLMEAITIFLGPELDCVRFGSPEWGRITNKYIEFGKLNGYRSTINSPYFDTTLALHRAKLPLREELLLSRRIFAEEGDVTVRRKISAALAIRTMRKDGTLPRAKAA